MLSHISSKFKQTYPPTKQPAIVAALAVDYTFADQGDVVFSILASADNPAVVRFSWYNSTAVAGSSPVVGLGSAANNANFLAASNTDEATTVSIRKFVANTDVYIGTVSGTWNAGAGVLVAEILGTKL